MSSTAGSKMQSGKGKVARAAVITHGKPETIGVALEQLAAESLVPTTIVEAQNLLTRMLVMMRLVAPGDVKPTPDTWQLVAEACGAGTWDALLAEHDAARQSIAALWNGIKQGAS